MNNIDEFDNPENSFDSKLKEDLKTMEKENDSADEARDKNMG